MRAAVFPDAEYLATTWLASNTTLNATVGTDLAGWTAGSRRIVINRIGGVPSVAIRVDNPRLDVAVWAETKAAAHDLAQQARAWLHEMPTGDFTALGAVVANVVDDVGMTWIPDPDTAAPRYTFTVQLALRPHP